VRIERLAGSRLGVSLPTYRGPGGRSLPAVSLPPELSRAIGAVVLEYYAERCGAAGVMHICGSGDE
jgi:hypothetical protein